MTTTYKTADLIGWRLDLAVALAEGAVGWHFTESSPNDLGYLYVRFPCGHPDDCDEPREEYIALDQYHPSREWHQGGPIIEREAIAIAQAWHEPSRWVAGQYAVEQSRHAGAEGPTPLVAAMRAFLRERVGGTLELPA